MLRRLAFLSLLVATVFASAIVTLTAGNNRDDRPQNEPAAPPITILESSGKTTPAAPAAATAKTVNVDVGPSNTLSFSPSSVTIVTGDTVTWTWQSSFHTVTSGSPCIVDSAYCSPNDTSCSTATTSNAGATYSHTFTQAGTFHYFCRIHCGSGMAGTVTVVEPFVTITSVIRDASGFTINGKTTPNTTITIQSAPDLATAFQNPATTTSNGSGNFTLADGSATTALMRFYKASYP